MLDLWWELLMAPILQNCLSWNDWCKVILADYIEEERRTNNYSGIKSILGNQSKFYYSGLRLFNFDKLQKCVFMYIYNLMLTFQSERQPDSIRGPVRLSVCLSVRSS